MQRKKEKENAISLHCKVANMLLWDDFVNFSYGFYFSLRFELFQEVSELSKKRSKKVPLLGSFLPCQSDWELAWHRAEPIGVWGGAGYKAIRKLLFDGNFASEIKCVAKQKILINHFLKKLSLFCNFFVLESKTTSFDAAIQNFREKKGCVGSHEAFWPFRPRR